MGAFGVEVGAGKATAPTTAGFDRIRLGALVAERVDAAGVPLVLVGICVTDELPPVVDDDVVSIGCVMRVLFL
jgi:hypothetical protein